MTSYFYGNIPKATRNKLFQGGI